MSFVLCVSFVQAEADVLDLCETACDVAADFLGLSDDQADMC